jgi:hypothetical protein
MVDQAFPYNRNGFKSAVRVPGEAWHFLTMVHAESVLDDEIIAQVTALQRTGGAHFHVPFGELVFVMDTKEKGVRGFPLESQGFDFTDGWHGGGVFCIASEFFGSSDQRSRQGGRQPQGEARKEVPALEWLTHDSGFYQESKSFGEASV